MSTEQNSHAKPATTPSSTHAQSPAEPSRPTIAENDHGDQLVTLRRAPSLLAFGVTGTVLGLALALVLTLAFTPTDMLTLEYSRTAVFGVLGVVLGAVGAAIGIVIALILDRSWAKKTETVRAIETDEEFEGDATPEQTH
ncbi:hypothetical protein [uncultured Rothia sp.]|uniref:hypothetical protein n=1 Tax=uncultured Rothia sp. TaxID=316088 RepID=UPI0032175F3A